MPRPKRPEDPDLYPTPCCRCNEHRQPAATWPDGVICVNCYQKAKRTRGVCACGHKGVLPGVIGGKPACRTCSGVQLNVDCVNCGDEEELYSGGQCWRCTLSEIVDVTLADPETGRVGSELLPLADALKSMKRANSGLTWIKQSHVQTFFQAIVTHDSITHQVVDSLPASQTREFVRGLLVEHGVLPRREEYLVRYKAWSDEAIKRLDGSPSADTVRRYVRWHHLRRMQEMGTVTNGSFLRAKQAVTVAIDLIIWLEKKHVSLEDLAQDDLDSWISQGPSTRQIASRFLSWAIKARIVAPHLKIAPHRRGGSLRMSAPEQDEAIQSVVHNAGLTPRERAAAMLVLVFGQRAEDILHLTWDQVTVTEGLVTIRMSELEIELPAPLDEPWRELASSAGEQNTAAHPNTRWVFPGYAPGSHLHGSYFRDWMKRHFSARAARLGSLHELSKMAPIAVIAEALGYTPETIERHAMDSSTNYARYISAIRVE